MTLTGIGGSLGIGNTQPTKKIDVFGDGIISGDLGIGADLSVAGDLSVTGSFSSNLVGNVTGNLTGNVTGNIDGNVYSTGISTFINVRVSTDITTGSSGGIGIGTDTPRSAVDFVGAGNTQSRFMLPPSVDNTVRVGLLTETGAVIYNTSINKLQVYTGTSWETITSA